jgi:cobalt-zinc-cadmium efflux system membrane fusion protein
MKRMIWVVALVLVAGCRDGSKPMSGQNTPAGKVDEQAKGGHDAHGHGPEKDEHGKKDDHGKTAKFAEHAEDDEHEGHGHGGKEEGGGDVVALAPEAVKAAKIAVAAAERRAVSGALSVPARVMFPQRGVARGGARVPGQLDDVKVEVGQRVKKGTVLGIIESPDLGKSRAEFLAALTKAKVAEGNYKREKELLAKGISSEREAREAEGALAVTRAELHTAEAHLHALGLTDEEIFKFRAEDHPTARFAIRSPIDGTVVEIAGTIGQSVEGTAPLFTVGDLSKLWVIADVYESQLKAVQVGSGAEVVVPAAPGRTFRGTVEAIGDVVDEKTRTVAVRIVVANADRALKPGMFATARITGAAAANRGGGVVVPRDAVQKVGERMVVFVPAGENRFRPVEVELGAESGGEIEIGSGIEEGTPVVTRGAFTLKAELSKGSLSGGHAGHGH